MKTWLNLGAVIDLLPAGVKDAVHALAKECGHKTENLGLRRVAFSEKAKDDDLVEGERSVIKYVSTRTLDRDNEVIVPKGIVLNEFEKYMHVLWGHNYSLPPVGSDDWIKADEFGIKAKQRYLADAPGGSLPDMLWRLTKDGHLRSSSIGFVPLAWTEPGHNDFDRVADKLGRDWPEFGKKRESVKRIITKGVLLEHSDVSVPANPDTDVLAIAKSYGADDKVLSHLKPYTEDEDRYWEYPPVVIRDAIDLDGAQDKRVIPFSVHGDGSKAPESTAWNGPREVAAAEIGDLKVMCAWYDAETADIKSSYKLPHHRASGHAVVWAGVRAAMGALLGARGGVNIPSSDRSGVYNHLKRHYTQFDKDPPELRDYVQGELKTLFPELYDTGPVVLRSVRPLERSVRVVSKGFDLDCIRTAINSELDKRYGSVL
jgi:hypothetical protein